MEKLFHVWVEYNDTMETTTRRRATKVPVDESEADAIIDFLYDSGYGSPYKEEFTP